MEPKFEAAQTQFGSGGMGCAFDEFHGLNPGPPLTGGSSFTALLELPPPQAVELLDKGNFPAKYPPPPIFPTDIGLIHRASKFSIFASADNSLQRMKLDALKQEQMDSDNYFLNSSSPAGSDQCLNSGKRKNSQKKVEESNKKSKNMVANETSGGGCGEKLPYIHVRARRGQATDSHSLAERARREKINARMKLLQELVPGCNKISGTAMVLDGIINHVQELQRQVEFLSMRLAAANLGIDSDLESLFPANGSSNDTGYTGLFTPPICPERQMNGTRQLWHCDEHHQHWARDADASIFITPANSVMSYGSSASHHFHRSSQLTMEL